MDQRKIVNPKKTTCELNKNSKDKIVELYVKSEDML